MSAEHAATLRKTQTAFILRTASVAAAGIAILSLVLAFRGIRRNIPARKNSTSRLHHLLTFLVLAALFSGHSHAADRKPNIVIIYTDNLGYGDLSCNNPKAAYETPRIDRMAKEGVRFTDAHSPSTICSPSRYGLFSGQQIYRSTGKCGGKRQFVSLKVRYVKVRYARPRGQGNRFYLDGKLTCTVTEPITRRPQFIILSPEAQA